MARKLPPIHPGEFLREDMLKPLGMSANALALALRVPATRIAEIIKERRGISADTALRLGRYFGMTAEFWMNWQKRYELETARDAAEKEINAAIRPASRLEMKQQEPLKKAA
jgi:addiction module HigA family antidote